MDHSQGEARYSEAKRVDRGAEAEEEVTRVLKGMSPDDFLAIDDVPFPGGNIDHVVIARTGAVFAIETKSSKGRVDSRGDTLTLNDAPMDRDPIDQALREALWVKDRMGDILGSAPYVTAVVLFTHANVNVRGRIRKVEVSSLKYLKHILTTLPSSNALGEGLWRRREEIASLLLSAGARASCLAA